MSTTGNTTVSTIAPALDDVIEQLVAVDTPWHIKDGPAGRVIVDLGNSYFARLSEDDGTVTVTFAEGWGTIGETRFSHQSPAQAFLVVEHIASLWHVVEVLSA